MRACDIDRSGKTWLYRPVLHKNSWRGEEREILLGPEARELVSRWMRPGLQEQYLFCPREAERIRREKLRAVRKTPLYPSHLRALAQKRKPEPKRQPGERYDIDQYRQAITRACKEAAVPHWHPNQLRHNAASLAVRPESKGTERCIRAQLSSALLWRLGCRAAFARVEQLAAAMLHTHTFTRPHLIARLDLCVDFQGWDPEAADLDRFVGRSKHRAQYHEGELFTGFGFGTGDIVGRLYDKSREIARSQKEWMWPIWEAVGASRGSRVWRLEFQLRREALREFDMGSLPEALEGLDGLWLSLMRTWLRLTDRGSASHRERWKTAEAWECLARADFGSSGGEVLREHRRNLDAKRLGAAILGNISSLANLHGCTDFDRALSAASAAARERLAWKGVSFADIVQAKALRTKGIPSRAGRPA